MSTDKQRRMDMAISVTPNTPNCMGGGAITILMCILTIHTQKYTALTKWTKRNNSLQGIVNFFFMLTAIFHYLCFYLLEIERSLSEFRSSSRFEWVDCGRSLSCFRLRASYTEEAVLWTECARSMLYKKFHWLSKDI